MLQIFRLLQSWGLHSYGMQCVILLGDWCLIFQDSVVVSSRRVKKSKNFPWIFNPSRWGHCPLSKSQAPIHEWHNTTSQKKRDFVVHFLSQW